LSNLQCFDQCHTRRYSNWRPVFRVKDFASTQTLHSIQEAPLFAILNIIELDWLLSSEARDICQSGPNLQKHVRVVVPSQGQLKHLYRVYRCPELLQSRGCAGANESSAKSESLFPLKLSEWTIISIPWFRDVVEYTQDVAICVWEPHLSPLPAVGASICISPDDLGSQKVIVVLKPSKSSDQSLYNLLEDLKCGIPDSVKGLSGVEIEITSTLLSIYSLLINDTSFLVERLITLCDNLVGYSSKFVIVETNV
jgi:hypothetical protein